MMFKDIALKNFKVNIKRYLIYFLCNSFIVATYFSYSVLIFNDKLWTTSQLEKGVLETLIIPSVALGVFSLLFISYAHSSFIKWRKKEFGVFMTLGMTIGDIRKIIIYESLLVCGSSILLGTLTGLVFSRLFFIIITKLLEVTAVSYIIGFRNFIFPIAIFSVIYIVNIITTIIATYKFEINKLLKSNRKLENNKFSNPILALIGLVIVAISFIGMYKDFMTENSGKSLLIATISILLGDYIFISQIGGFLIKRFKKRKNIYYKSLLFLTNLNSKFKQTKKIIFIISILVSVVIFYIGFILSIYVTSEQSTINNNIYDISYAEIRDKNIIISDRFNDIVLKNNEEVKVHKEAEFILYYGTEENQYQQIIMVDKEISKLSNSNIKVNKDHYIDINQNEKISETEKENFNSHNLTVVFNNYEKKLYGQDIIFKNIFRGGNYYYNNITVVNEEDYNLIKLQNEYFEIGKLQLYNFNSWKNTKGIVEELTETLDKSNENTEKFKSKLLNEKEYNYLKVSSRIGDYNYDKQGGILILVTSSYLGIFFFMAICIILFLKLLSDMEDDKLKFNSMIKIGIMDYEIKKQIGSELKPLFFIGPIIGIILAVGYTIVFSQDTPKDLKKYMFLSNILISLIFIFIQVIYYFICKNIYYNEMLDNK